jgi:hypothetical protein
MTEVRAPHGDKMIEIKLRFWTNNIASEGEMIVPKHAWDFGMVRMERNDAHGIKASKGPKPFHSLQDAMRVVEEVLIEYGIKLHHSPKKSGKLFVQEEVATTE